MNHRLIAAGGLLVSLTLPGILASQSSWRPSPDAEPAGRRGHFAAFDEARQRLVLFGGDAATATFGRDDTWEWDGGSWRALTTPGPKPSQRYYGGMVYDVARANCVLFGGIESNTLRGDTWTWDGQSWSEVMTAPAPPARSTPALVYDGNRGRTWLFGGGIRFGSNAALNDMWEFDGSQWVEIVHTNGPGPVLNPSAAYDSIRRRVVLYDPSQQQFWEWDGSVWELAHAGPILGGRGGIGMAFDASRNRTVIYGGARGINGSFSDTWTWDGSQLRQINTPTDAGPRSDSRAVYDSVSSRVLVTGGITSGLFSRTSSIAAFDGQSWSRLTATHPSLRLDSSVAWNGEPGGALAFGGRLNFIGATDVTYLRDANGWRTAAPTTRPGPRFHHGLVWDRARREVLMFGGSIGSAVIGETWIWDGSDWRQHVGTEPAPRERPAMAFDARRERVILFGGGGFLFARPFQDTWSWDGSTWEQLLTSNSPLPLTRSAMAYDSRRDRCVLFGGRTNAAARDLTGETWEFDGQDWVQATPAHSPSPRADHTMVYDPVADRVVLFGGDGLGKQTDTWEWDGQDWTEVASPSYPYFLRSVFDEQLARTMGYADAVETWEYRTDSPPALTSYGAGCGSATLVPEPFEYPVLGTTFTLRLDTRPLWVAVLWIGDRRLQVALDPIGMPGCSLLQSADVTRMRFADRQGTARFELSVPSDSALLGITAETQGLTLEPNTNQLGWVTTAGLTLQVGH